MIVTADTSRDCLYTLSENNVLSVYKPNGAKTLQHLQTLSNIYKIARDKAAGFPTLTLQSFQIVSLHVWHPRIRVRVFNCWLSLPTVSGCILDLHQLTVLPIPQQPTLFDRCSSPMSDSPLLTSFILTNRQTYNPLRLLGSLPTNRLMVL